MEPAVETTPLEEEIVEAPDEGEVAVDTESDEPEEVEAE